MGIKFVRTNTDRLESGSDIGHGIGTGSFTVVTWLRLDSTASTKTFWGVGNAVPEIYIQATPNIGIFWSGDVSNNYTDVTLDTNRWYHIGWRRKGSEASAWNDGIKNGATGTSTAALPDEEMYWGASQAGDYFDGDLAESAVYNIALSEWEFRRLAVFRHSPLLVRPEHIVNYRSMRSIIDVNHDFDRGFSLTPLEKPSTLFRNTGGELTGHPPGIIYPEPDLTALWGSVTGVVTGTTVGGLALAGVGI